MAYVTGVVGAAVLVLWGLAAFAGYGSTTTPNNQVPQSVRSSPGGYRSWSFWHAGTHGGK